MKVRLHKFLADCGVASRREAEAMVAEGRVRVNGTVRREMPVMVDPEVDIVQVDGAAVEGSDGKPREVSPEQVVYYLLNKPKGILVTNYDPSHRKTVSELMTGVAERLFPVGRLDMDSRGALIMTNDGELANRLAHPRYGVEKTYVVEVDGRMGAAELERLKRGMWLGPEHAGQRPQRTERFSIKLIGRERGRTILEVKIAEGKNREIRRVMARTGHTVRDLNRVAIAGKVTLGTLKVGTYRKLTDDEVKWLYKTSSQEYHEREKAATQAWYEAKEREKERKRLAREAAAPKGKETGRRSDGATGRGRQKGGMGERANGGKSKRPPVRAAAPRGPQREHGAGHPLGGLARGEDDE